jgi:flagellar hook-associated protein FlgK
VTRQYTTGDAGFQIRGRYEGDHVYDPAQPWRMRVLSSGTIGDANNPPVVGFTWFDGENQERIEKSISVVLDDAYPPGAQVPIGAGIYAVFDEGVLSAGAAGVDIVVDGEEDSAGLLSALGLNSLLIGDKAGKVAVAKGVSEDVDRLSLGHTRAAGDNAAFLAFGELSDQPVFGKEGQRLSDFYLSSVSAIAVRIDQNSNLLSTQETVQLALQNRRDEVSGVSVDEEVGRLILQQQAYTAAARVVNIARENIQTLLDLFR